MSLTKAFKILLKVKVNIKQITPQQRSDLQILHT